MNPRIKHHSEVVLTVLTLALVASACDKKEEAAADSTCPATSDPAVAALLDGTEQVDASGCPVVAVTSADQPDTGSAAGTVTKVEDATDADKAAKDDPPPALASFAVTAGTYLGGLNFTLGYPSVATDIEKVIIRAKEGATAPASCTDGQPVLYVYSGFSGTVTIPSWGKPGKTYSFLACAVDAADQATPSVPVANVTTIAKHRIFTSSATYTGDLNSTFTNGSLNLYGIDGADARCQGLAETANLGGQWKAMMSSLGGSAKTRLKIHGPVFNTKPVPEQIAADRAGFVGTTLAHSIAYDENGQAVTGNAWVGTNTNFLRNDYACSQWSDGSSLSYGYIGDVTATDSTWIASNISACQNAAHLYCVEQMPDGIYPELYSLDVTAGANAGDYIVSAAFPWDTDGIAKIEIMRGNGIAGASRDCVTGTLVKTFLAADISSAGVGTYTDATGSMNPISYRACAYDAEGNLLSSKHAIAPYANAQYIFPTSVKWNGKLTAAFDKAHPADYATGLEGADARCKAVAENAGLGAFSWKALLSTSANDAKNRVPVNGKVYDTGGTLTASNSAALWDSSVDAQILNSEFGDQVPSGQDIWTGSASTGVKINATNDMCQDWTANVAGGTNGQVGWDEMVSGSWFGATVASCDTKEMIYCLSE